MIDFQKHFQRLQTALGVKNASGKNCADIIDEQLWRDHVTKALNEISRESAGELQQETGKPYPKDSLLKESNGNIRILRKEQKYSEAPPTRLLSMTLNLIYWLGFFDASNDYEMHEGAIGAWKRIEMAYQSGKAAHHNSKSNQPNANTDSDRYRLGRRI